jgi:hypothetical protein
VARAQWPETTLKQDDRLEIVHFVGGGCGDFIPARGFLRATTRP